MPDNLQGGMSQPLLPAGAIIRLEALDPTTGVNIATVKISNVVISGTKIPASGDGFVELASFVYTPGATP